MTELWSPSPAPRFVRCPSCGTVHLVVPDAVILATRFLLNFNQLQHLRPPNCCSRCGFDSKYFEDAERPAERQACVVTTEETPIPRAVKCAGCGWVHFALSPAEIQDFVTAENAAGYRKCSRCGAPDNFVPAGPDDAPLLANVPVCVMPDD